MTQTELERGRLALQKKCGELIDANRVSESFAIESGADEMDQIQGRQERELAIGSLDRNARLLRCVRAALDRIDAGTFGICLHCESAIAAKRLAAVPWAALCIVCQEADDANSDTPVEGEDTWVLAA